MMHWGKDILVLTLNWHTQQGKGTGSFRLQKAVSCLKVLVLYKSIDLIF